MESLDTYISIPRSPSYDTLFESSIDQRKSKLTGLITIDLEELDKLELAPSPDNMQKYIDVISNNKKYIKIINDFNLRESAEITRYKHDKHELNDSCKKCGYNKCDFNRLNSKQFCIKLKFKTNILRCLFISEDTYLYYRFKEHSVSLTRPLSISKLNMTIWYSPSTFIHSRDAIARLLKDFRCGL